MVRWIAGITLFVAGFVLLGDPSATRVLIAMALMSLGVFVLCGKHVVGALVFSALILVVGSTWVWWLVFVAIAFGAAAFVIAGTGRAKLVDRAPDAVPIGDGAPFVDVEERIFRHPSGRKTAVATLAVPAIAVVAGIVVQNPVIWALGASLLVVLALVWLLAWRPQYRVDGDGLHGRFFLGTTTIRWRDVTAIDTLHARSQRYWYYDLHRVHSAGGMIRFYSTVQGCDELKDVIAAATGLSWE